MNTFDEIKKNELLTKEEKIRQATIMSGFMNVKFINMIDPVQFLFPMTTDSCGCCDNGKKIDKYNDKDVDMIFSKDFSDEFLISRGVPFIGDLMFIMLNSRNDVHKVKARAMLARISKIFEIELIKNIEEIKKDSKDIDPVIRSRMLQPLEFIRENILFIIQMLEFKSE